MMRIHFRLTKQAHDMTSRWSGRRAAYRAVLEGGVCVHPGSVSDPISARIAEELDYEVGLFAGSVASMAILGAPDLIAITLSEFAEQTHRICRAVERLPLMVDADHGYGNALNVMRTVEELETAGVACLSIEDTDLPQPYGKKGASLIPIEEGVGKMKAALSARRDSSLCIAGRTSALQIAGLDEAIARAKAYEAAGVDVLFMIGFKEEEQLTELAKNIKTPIILGGAPAGFSKEFMAAQGVRICLQGHQQYAAQLKAVYETLKALRDGVAPADLQNIPDSGFVKRLTRDADYAAWLRDYQGSG